MEENKNKPEQDPKPGYLKPDLNRLESDFSEGLWGKIDGQIPKRKKKRFFIWWWLSGVFFFASVAGSLYFYSSQKDSITDSNLVTLKKSTNQKDQGLKLKKDDSENSPTELPVVKNEKSNPVPQENGQTPSESISKNDVSKENAQTTPSTKKSNKKGIIKEGQNQRVNLQNVVASKEEEGSNKQLKTLDNSIVKKQKRKKERVASIAKVKDLEPVSNRPTANKIRIVNAPATNPDLKKEASQLVYDNSKNDNSRLKPEPDRKSVSNQNEEKGVDNVVENTIPAFKPIPEEQKSNVKNESTLQNQPSAKSTDSLPNPLIALKPKVDSIPLKKANEDSTIHKKMKKGEWMAGFGFGSLYQKVQLTDFVSKQYSSENQESNVRFDKNSFKPTLAFTLHINRLWTLGKSFNVGLRGRSGLVFQQVETELLAGRFSSSKFSFGADSLNITAISNALEGTRNFQRTTWFCDAGILLNFRRPSSPFGIGISWPLIRFQTTFSGPDGSNGSEVQYFLRPPDVRIYYFLKPRLEIYTESQIMNWENFAIPLPIENTGRSIGLQIGLGFHW